MSQTQKQFTFSADQLQDILTQFIQASFSPQTAEPERKQEIPTMLTVKEAAERFHVSEYAIRSLIRRHLIPCVRLGARILVNQSALIDYFSGGQKND